MGEEAAFPRPLLAGAQLRAELSGGEGVRGQDGARATNPGLRALPTCATHGLRCWSAP